MCIPADAHYNNFRLTHSFNSLIKYYCTGTFHSVLLCALDASKNLSPSFHLYHVVFLDSEMESSGHLEISVAPVKILSYCQLKPPSMIAMLKRMWVEGRYVMRMVALISPACSVGWGMSLGEAANCWPLFTFMQRQSYTAVACL